MSFLKRFISTLGDLVTSKKAIVAAISAVAVAAGHPDVGAAIGAFVVAQGIADAGKEAARIKATWAVSDADLAAKLKIVREAQGK